MKRKAARLSLLNLVEILRQLPHPLVVYSYSDPNGRDFDIILMKLDLLTQPCERETVKKICRRKDEVPPQYSLKIYYVPKRSHFRILKPLGIDSFRGWD